MIHQLDADAAKVGKARAQILLLEDHGKILLDNGAVHMFRKSLFVSVLILLVLYLPVKQWAGSAEVDRFPISGMGSATTSELAQRFMNPPPSARPSAYWAWMNGNVSLPQLTRDLEEMKDKGLSGAYIFDVGARDPDGIIPAGPAFMGPESLTAIAHAVREATRLGLELGLVTSSSWNAGGSWVAPRHASMGLCHSETIVNGPAHFSQTLPFPSVPNKAPKGPDGFPVCYKDVAVLAFPQTKEKLVEDVTGIIDLTDRVDKDGCLTWNVPAGRWVVMRFVCANTGQGLAIPSPNSHGLVLDHFSPKATDMHFQYLIDRLLGELGSFEETALKYMYLCSYEVRGQVWTPDLLREFKKRRGYDMTPYLPVLFGFTAHNKETTERFQYDFRKTLGELLADAFYRRAREISNRHGLLLCAEAGGPGPPTHQVPVDALKALGALDIPRGEFWNKHNVWVVKETACASHIYGKKIVDMEAFTSWRHWQDGPFDIKPLADRAMCGGANHFTFHTFAHNPPEAGKPGWVYHAGTHINPNVVWWPKAKPFIDYLARCSYLLQQGLFVADVCYYYGDQGFNFVPPKHVDPSLGFGYDYDVTNAEVILTRMSVENGRIVLPDGMSYELLVLPDREDMNLEVLQKLQKLVKAGATVVGRKPLRSSGLTDYPQQDEKVRRLADRLWGPCDGEKIKQRSYGKGKIIWGRTLREILWGRSIGPDFSYTSRNEGTDLDYIHRRTETADIFFVSNKNMRWEEVDCVFRVTGKAPELCMPDTGEMREQLVYMSVEGGTKVPLRLSPAGSVFVVFREKAEEDRIVSVSRDDTRVFPVTAGIAEEIPPIEVLPGDHNKVELLAWRDGKYVLQMGRGGKIQVEVKHVPAVREITGPWEVRFPEGWGAPASKVFPKLISWTDHPDHGIRYFSGIATYCKEFDLPSDLIGTGKQLVLDLGRVKFVADAYLNGEHLGILWKPPFRLDITNAARSGRNGLVVEVANVWSNRLTGDAHLPKNKRYCRTNMKKSLTWRSPWKDTPLQESGLLGPVRLLPAKTIIVKLPG